MVLANGRQNGYKIRTLSVSYRHWSELLSFKDLECLKMIGTNHQKVECMDNRLADVLNNCQPGCQQPFFHVFAKDTEDSLSTRINQLAEHGFRETLINTQMS